MSKRRPSKKTVDEFERRVRLAAATMAVVGKEPADGWPYLLGIMAIAEEIDPPCRSEEQWSAQREAWSIVVEEVGIRKKRLLTTHDGQRLLFALKGKLRKPVRSPKGGR